MGGGCGGFVGCSRRGAPGTMRASPPTVSARGKFSFLSETLRRRCRGGCLHPPGGRLRFRGVPGGEESRPYAWEMARCQPTAMATAFAVSVGASIARPQEVCGGAGFRRDEGIPPYGRFCGLSPTHNAGQYVSLVRRGRIHPARGRFPRRKVSRAGNARPYGTPTSSLHRSVYFGAGVLSVSSGCGAGASAASCPGLADAYPAAAARDAWRAACFWGFAGGAGGLGQPKHGQHGGQGEPERPQVDHRQHQAGQHAAERLPAAGERLGDLPGKAGRASRGLASRPPAVRSRPSNTALRCPSGRRCWV